MKRPNPDTVSPGAFNGVSARAAARPDHGQPRLPPEPAGRTRSGRPGGPAPGQVPGGCPAHPRARRRREARREDQDPARARRHASDERLARRAFRRRKCRARLALALPSPPVLATPCRPSIAMPCRLALATPRRPAMSVPCRPALATLCRPAMAVPSQLPAAPGRKPWPGPLLQRRPSRPLPPPGSLPPLSRRGPLPRPRPLARPGLRCGL